MTSKQLSAALKKLDVHPSAAAAFLGVTLRTIQNWKAGAPIPRAVAYTLRMMMRYQLTAEVVAEEYGD